MTWALENARQRCEGCKYLYGAAQGALCMLSFTPYGLWQPTSDIGPHDCPLGRVAMPDPDTVDLERERLSALFSADRSIETMFPGIAAETDRVLGKAKEEEVENG